MGRELTDLQLTTTEQSELAALEGIIERGLKTFVEVGNALLQIRDNRLYRASHGTFEEYCRARWGFKRTYAFYLIEAAQVVNNLGVHNCEQLPQTESQARPLTQLEPEQQREAWQRAVETAPNGKITAAHVENSVEAVLNDVAGTLSTLMNFAASDLLAGGVPHVAYNTGESEWYTPREFIDAARKVMGEIDLDPASCEVANRTVRAETFYDAAQDGLAQDWFGRVWMNPPYANPLVAQFAEKLTASALCGDVIEAIALVNNATETKWFARLMEAATAVCFPTGRVRFLDPQGNPGAPLQGQAIVYIGKNKKKFLEAFRAFGWCCHV